jgi:hypothetical protein
VLSAESTACGKFKITLKVIEYEQNEITEKWELEYYKLLQDKCPGERLKKWLK